MTKLYLIFVSIISLMKRLYKKRNTENSINTVVLACLMITLNVVGLIGLIYHYLGGHPIKYNTDISQRGFKVLLLTTFVIGILLFSNRINRKLTNTQKIKRFRKIIKNTPKKAFAIAYIVFSIIFSFTVLFVFYN